MYIQLNIYHVKDCYRWKSLADTILQNLGLRIYLQGDCLYASI
jgi:hypothetical protein